MPVMSHPLLPAEQTITVPDEVAFHLERAGWVLETSADDGDENPAEPDHTDQLPADDTKE